MMTGLRKKQEAIINRALEEARNLSHQMIKRKQT